MQPADIAVELRPRSQWEAMDLGLAMLQRWWRQIYASHAIVLALLAASAFSIGGWLERPWVAPFLIWWLKPVYDRVVLHVLSRAVFGELQGTRAVLGAWKEWLGTGVITSLTLRRFETARSFNLPVRQLEGQSGRAARERLAVLGRRAHGSAVWLTVVCMHFEAVLFWSLQLFANMLLPAKALEAGDFFVALGSGAAWTWGDAIAYAGAILVLEPFYVAAGFALYLNRRTLLEGWDLEVALRRLAERHAAIAAMVLLSFCLAFPHDSYAQKNPKAEIAEVLKAPEFPHERDTTRWVLRNPSEPGVRETSERPGFAIGGWIAQLARLVLWVAIGAGVAYLLWWLYRMLPRLAAPPREAYRPPASLFGMELAPESLPDDVPHAALSLAQQGKFREALALLYRGSLSRLIHQRGVQLLASHTEAEVLGLAPKENEPYLEQLIDAWRACAYASRPPALPTVVQLADGYRAL